MTKLVIVPAISAGNIPQLAIDLLIHTLGAQRICALDDKFLYPFAGAQDYVEGERPSNDGGFTRAAEAYTKDNITLIQLRSPPFPGMQWEFVQKTLFPFLNDPSNGFTDIIVASSSNAGLIERHLIPPNRLKLYSDSDVLCQRLASLSVSTATSATTNSPSDLPLAESGFTKDILRHAHELADKNVSSLVMFSYEGDNFDDATTMAAELVKAAGLDLPAPKWKMPKSWQGVYGRAIPSGLEQGLYS